MTSTSALVKVAQTANNEGKKSSRSNAATSVMRRCLSKTSQAVSFAHRHITQMWDFYVETSPWDVQNLSYKEARIKSILEYIHAHPDDKEGYKDLAEIKEPDETIILLDGREMTEGTLFLEVSSSFFLFDSVRLEVLKVLPRKDYPKLRDPDQEKIQQFLEGLLRKNPQTGVFYLAIAMFLYREATFKVPDGRQLDQIGMIVESIRLDPNIPIAYFLLGMLLDDDPLGRLPKKSHLGVLLEMLRCDRENPLAWALLAEESPIRAEKGVQLLDRTALSTKQVYLNAFRYNPYHPEESLKIGLAAELSLGEIVHLSPTKTATAVGLYLEVLDEKIGFQSQAYCGLAVHSRNGITFPQGHKMTQRELFLEALKHDSKNAKAREHLQKTLRIAEFIDLPDGTVLRHLKEKIPEALKV